MNLIRDDVTNHVTKLGQPISYRRKVEELGPVGARYAVVNTGSLTPPIGQLNIPPSGLTLRINATDADLIDHTANINTLVAGDIITIGTATAILTGAPILNTGVFSLQVAVLPVLADGSYRVKATKV
jgi:hypothetical protein